MTFNAKLFAMSRLIERIAALAGAGTPERRGGTALDKYIEDSRVASVAVSEALWVARNNVARPRITAGSLQALHRALNGFLAESNRIR